MTLVRALLSAWLFFGATTAFADAHPVTDGDVTTGQANGIDVIVKRVPHAEWVAAQLYIRGGVGNWSSDNAGVERLALRTSIGGGTEHLDRDTFLRRLTKLGAELSTDSNEDFSVVEARSLRDHWQDRAATSTAAGRSQT
jgi:predicted Zn-dependent peptidase